MRETWYVLEDGAVADPSEVSPDEAGRLRHRSGTPVAMRGEVPRSRSVDPAEERGKAKPSKPASKDMKPDDQNKRPYRTRESKAE